MIKDVMQDAEYQRLKETGWRRRLTATERARMRELLAAHPEWQESWEQEAALNGLLRRMPTAALSTNFTARVIQAAQRLPAKPAWRRRLEMLPWLPESWAPRLALATAMVCCGLFTCHEYEVWHRTRVGRELVRDSVLLPSVNWLENFDTIDRMNKVKVADDELLAVLQ
jgi:hypothetical protein